MSDRKWKCLLAFLWLDLIVSLLWLGYAAHQNGNHPLESQSVTSSSSGAPDVEPEVSSVASASAVAQQSEGAQVKEQVTATRRQVTQEVTNQTQTFSQLTGNDHWVTLKELEAISPQAYQDFVRSLEYKRQQAAKRLEARQQFLAEWQAGILSDEETAEVMEALEFLNICDQNTAEGTPIPDRSADFDWNRKQRLRKLLKEYCCAISGLSEADLEKRELGERLTSSSANAYIVIVPSNLNQLELQ
ncbi:MAG: hypothetical protein II943_00980 [Victivallales bacterium]|nr:hypothetical protein [Victivallales bacterium]